MKALPLFLLALSALFSVSCATKDPLVATRLPQPQTYGGYQTTGQIYHGKASWYSVRTNGGYATASGERLNQNAATAAHKYLPMGTRVKVTNQSNGSSKVVRINDRGPYIKGRIIDVTVGVAGELGFVNRGVVPVTVEVLKKTPTPPPPPVRASPLDNWRNEEGQLRLPKVGKALRSLFSSKK